MKTLTPKQERFCQEYIVDCNATAAAERAEYSKKTAAQLGYQLMQIPEVLARIDELKRDQTKRTEIQADTILQRLDQIGGVDMAECFTELGALKNIHDIPKELRQCIASIEVLEVEEMVNGRKQKIGETKKIKFWDKLRANELIGKHKKMFTERHDHTHRLGKTLEDIVDGSNQLETVPPQISGKKRKDKSK